MTNIKLVTENNEKEDTAVLQKDANTISNEIVYEANTIDEYKDVLTQIKNQEQTAATIVLGADINNSSSADKFAGVADKHIIYIVMDTKPYLQKTVNLLPAVRYLVVEIKRM